MAKKILLIDDDPTMIKMLQTFLTAHGYVISVATDGDDGLAQLKNSSPDLIVLDVQMPKMNGYTFMFELKKVPNASTIPIIVLTAKQGMAEIFKVEGVKEYVTKPFQPEALLTQIKKYI